MALFRFHAAPVTLVVTLALASGIAVGQTFTPVAMTNSDTLLGPGAEAEAVFFDLGLAVVDALGNVTFHAGVMGPNTVSGTENGIWTWTGVANTPVVREGEMSPYDGSPISFLSNAPNAGDGSVVASADGELFVFESSLLNSLAHTGEPAPGLGGGVFYGFMDSPATDGAGTYGFFTGLTGAVDPSNFEAAFVGELGAMQLLARSSDVAPGTGGDTFSGIQQVSMGGDGSVGLLASLTGTGAQGIWTGGVGTLTRHIVNGDVAPGMPTTPTDTTFVSLLAFSAGDNGSIILKGYTDGAGVTSLNNEGVWVGPPGALALAFREGDQVPGLPDGVKFASQTTEFKPPSINSSGEIAVLTRLSGVGVNFTNWQAIVAGAPGALETVARTGDVMPDSGGWTLYNITEFAHGDSGHVAFICLITDGALFQVAVYAWHVSTGLMLVARAGDVIDMGVGGMQTINNIEFRGFLFGSGGYATSLGDGGDLALKFNFASNENGIAMMQLPGGGNPADFNGDGIVDGVDLAALLAAWGTCPPPCDADLNGDGALDGIDLAALLAAWG